MEKLNLEIAKFREDEKFVNAANLLKSRFTCDREKAENAILALAGPKGSRWCIYDGFMTFVGDYAEECMNLQPLLLEVGMQRLGCGAIIADKKHHWSFTEVLPATYQKYGAAGEEPHLMSDACCHFVVKALPVALKNPMLKQHALNNLIGLVQHLTPEGKEKCGYSFGWHEMPDKEEKAKFLYSVALNLVEDYAADWELFDLFATPTEWYKHQYWFNKQAKAGKLDWDEFFDAIKVDGGRIKKFFRKRKIKKQILNWDIPVAGR